MATGPVVVQAGQELHAEAVGGRVERQYVLLRAVRRREEVVPELSRRR
jgi:hypothetical protein